MSSDDILAVPDGTPPVNCTSDFSSASSSEHQLITYYQDVTEEVDLHFNRALSLSSTSSSCNDLHRITLTNGKGYSLVIMLQSKLYIIMQ